MTGGVEPLEDGEAVRTCKENIAPVQNGILVSHFHNVHVQFLHGFFHDLSLEGEGGGAQKQRDIEIIWSYQAEGRTAASRLQFAHVCKREKEDLFASGSVKPINLRWQHYSDSAQRSATPTAGRDDIILMGRRMMSF